MERKCNMKDQQVIEQTLDSREVAEMVEKRHDHLIRDIKKYIKEMAAPNFGEGNLCKIEAGDFFREGEYKDANGQIRPCYQITLKGCEFIAHKLTGVKGTAFTARYINRFHEMQERLTEQIDVNKKEQLPIQITVNLQITGQTPDGYKVVKQAESLSCDIHRPEKIDTSRIEICLRNGQYISWDLLSEREKAEIAVQLNKQAMAATAFYEETYRSKK